MKNETPAPLQGSSPVAQLLILIGLTFVSIFFLTIIILLIHTMSDVNLLDTNLYTAYNNPDVIKVIKILQIASSIVIFILPVIIFTILFSRNRMDYLQINRMGKLSILLLGGIVMIVASPLINYLQEINSHLQLPQWMSGVEAWMKSTERQDDALTAAFLNHQTFQDLIVNLIMIGLVAAVSEELFFRGVFQKIVINMTRNMHVGIWVTGAIFSAVHLQFYGFLPRMLMGVYLSYLFVWSRSIWVPIFAHFINNGSAVVFAYLEERKIISGDVDKVGTQGSEYVYIIVSTILVVCLLVAIYKLSQKKDTEDKGIAIISE